MIPPPVDPGLIREHRYEETKDLSIVLNPLTVKSNSGYRPIKDYGLGYFNYEFGEKRVIHKVTRSGIIYAHLHKNFNIYFALWLIFCLVWCAYIFDIPGKLAATGSRYRKDKNADEDSVDTVYHHMKV